MVVFFTKTLAISTCLANALQILMLLPSRPSMARTSESLGPFLVAPADFTTIVTPSLILRSRLLLTKGLTDRLSQIAQIHPPISKITGGLQAMTAKHHDTKPSYSLGH